MLQRARSTIFFIVLSTIVMVVAAIRGVTTGGYLAHIKEEYEAEPLKQELEGYLRVLIGMTEQYEAAVKKVTEFNNREFIDFHAHRMVEMAGQIIMSYLLLLDCNREHNFWKTFEVYMKYGAAQVAAHAHYIKYSTPNDIGKFKIE